MKAAPVLAAVFAGSALSLPASLYADESVTRPTVPLTGPKAAVEPGDAGVLVQAIRQAPDPSTAIQAYANAKSADPGYLAIDQAFVRRMVDLGLPEMADAQARELTQRVPDDGLAWAVTGYMNAKRDQMEAAATAMANAVRRLPDDPFVSRTAGQIVAWYDSRPDRSQLPEATRTAVESIWKTMENRPGYADAYRDASITYRRLAETPVPTSQPSTSGQPTAAAPPTTATPEPPTLTSPAPYTYTPTYYPDTYYSPPPVYSTYDPYWYPGTYGAGFWWWPTFSSVVIVGQDFCHHHPDFVHHHGFNHHGFDGNHHNGNFHNGNFHDGDFHGGTFAGPNRNGFVPGQPHNGNGRNMPVDRLQPLRPGTNVMGRDQLLAKSGPVAPDATGPRRTAVSTPPAAVTDRQSGARRGVDITPASPGRPSPSAAAPVRPVAPPSRAIRAPGAPSASFTPRPAPAAIGRPAPAAPPAMRASPAPAPAPARVAGPSASGGARMGGGGSMGGGGAHTGGGHGGGGGGGHR